MHYIIIDMKKLSIIISVFLLITNLASFKAGEARGWNSGCVDTAKDIIPAIGVLLANFGMELPLPPDEILKERCQILKNSK